MRVSFSLVAAVLVSTATISTGQTLPGLGGKAGGLQGLPGGLLGGGLPNLASSSVGNLTGVLGYCVKNKFLGGNTSNATGVLNGLSGRTGVTSSKDFTLGQTGILQTGNGTLPLSNLGGSVRTRMCDMVLKQANKLL